MLTLTLKERLEDFEDEKKIGMKQVLMLLDPVEG
jgi:hypothetical protein